MKRIRFKSLRLLNFCGAQEASYEFGDNITIISGQNGAGKSTIANAITYVLFGTDIKGNTFEIKTYDAQHKIIPEIPHEAELTLTVDGEEITLKRTLTDVWKGEKVTNTYKYFIDGELTSATDFKKKVDEICDEHIFRLASSPSFFLSMPWQRQRQLLESLSSETTPAEVTNGESKYDFVVEATKKESIDKFVHHLKFLKSQVQKQLDDIPARKSELEKALPEKLDWDSLQADFDKLKKDETYTQSQIDEIKDGGADKVVNDGIRKRLEFEYKRKDNMEKSARVESGNREVKYGSDMVSMRLRRDKAESTLQELQAKMNGYTESEVDINQQIGECKSLVKGINAQKETLEKIEWRWDDEDNKCPHCGQPLPMDQLNVIKSESQKKFNQNKADGLKKMAEKFADIKDRYDKAKAMLVQLNEERQQTTADITEARKNLKDVESNLSKLKAERAPSAEEILKGKPEYQEVLNNIASLEADLQKKAVDTEKQKLLTDQEEKLKGIKEEIASLAEKLSSKLFFDKITKQIEDVQNDKKTFQDQIDELDSKIDIASEYYQRSCSILEENINNHFSFVKWSLFTTNLEGDKKPFCECYHDGVPYSSLNSAAKVNAGIDIAYTIAEHYDVSVPLIIDECESVLTLICPMNSQQIRFYVRKGDIKVEHTS